MKSEWPRRLAFARTSYRSDRLCYHQQRDFSAFVAPFCSLSHTCPARVFSSHPVFRLSHRSLTDLSELDYPRYSDKKFRPAICSALHWLQMDKKALPYETHAVIKRLFSYTDENYYQRMLAEDDISTDKSPADDTHFIVFSDASRAGWGVVEMSPQRISCFSAPFRMGRAGGLPPFDTRPSIEYNELIAAVHGIVHTIATSDKVKSVTALVDNKEIVQRTNYWLNKQRWQDPDTHKEEDDLLNEQDELLKEKAPSVVDKVIDNIIQQLLARTRKSGVELNVCWIPGYMNLADAPSRGYIRNFQHLLGKMPVAPAVKAKKEKTKPVKAERVKKAEKPVPEPTAKLPPMDLDANREETLGDDMFSDFYKEVF